MKLNAVHIGSIATWSLYTSITKLADVGCDLASWAEGARAGATSAELGDRPGRPGWLDRPKSNGFDRFGRLRPTKVDRKGRQSDREGDFGSILRRFSIGFSLFFEVASRKRVDVQCDGPNPCFC